MYGLALCPGSFQITEGHLAQGVQARALQAGDLVGLLFDSEEDLVRVREAGEEAGRWAVAAVVIAAWWTLLLRIILFLY